MVNLMDRNTSKPDFNKVNYMKQSHLTFLALVFVTIILFVAGTSLAKEKNTSRQQSAYGTATVTKWADNKKSAFTLSFDDAKISQFTYVRPILNTYGLNATFFLITGEVCLDHPNWEYGYWWQYDSLAHEGNEIGSHTITHPELDTLAVGSINQPGTLDYELYQSKMTIEKMIPGYKCISFAYPYCVYNNSVINEVSKFYENARSCGAYSDPSSISGADLYKIQAVDIYFNHPRGTTTDDEAFDIYTDNILTRSINTGGWANFYAHDVLPWNQISDTANSDTTICSTYFFDKLCNWVKQESDSNNIWEATFGNVTRYIKERENFTYNILSSTNSQIILSTAIGTLDTSIYNYPLTIDISVPQNWKEVTITQGNSSVVDSSFYNGTYYVVRVHVVPGKDNVVLNSGPFYTVSGHVYYDNSRNSPISNVEVVLSSSNGSDSTTTDSTGLYSFDNVASGNYNISLSKNSGWGGVNSTDALVVVKYFLHQISLDSLQQKASDVNNNMQINSTDALMISNRFINKIKSFSIPDWIFSGNNQITISDQNVIDDFKGIAAGDANSSLIP